jgi:soluble lytic murein transglycosylase-like protein
VKTTYFFILSVALIGFCTELIATPIYVYRRGKAITFTDRKPPAGMQAEIFKAAGKSFSTFKYSSTRFHSKDSYAKRAKLSPDFDKYIRDASKEFGVDRSLIRAVIHAESGFNPKAVSPKGALGLMQLMPGTARRHGVRRAFEPKENIRGGTKHLAWLIKRFRGNLIYSIAAYNAGEGAVDQHKGIPPYTETQKYVQKVLALKERYKGFA